MKKDSTASARVKKDQERKLQAGYRRLSNIWLNPEAAASLAELEKSGETATGIVNRLLIQALRDN